MDTNSFTPPPSSGNPPPLRPTVALRDGWRTFVARPGVSLLAFLLYLVGSMAGQIPFVGFLFFLLGLPALAAGSAGFLLRGVRGEQPPATAVFDGFDRWSSATGAVLMTWAVALVIFLPTLGMLIGTIGLRGIASRAVGFTHLPPPPTAALVWACAMFAATYPVMVWWGARMSMVVFTVMEPERPSAMTAFRETWALTQGSTWRLIGLMLLGFPVILLGLLALVVGVIPAAMVMYYAYAHAYEQLRARRVPRSAAAVA